MTPKATFYPSGRDVNIKTASKWMDSKRLDDKIGPGLWRVHDKLYNLTEFAKQHPGGRFWIDETEGTDITEAFESAHVFGAEVLLEKYFVTKTTTPRLSRFTFSEEGFYKTLKKRVAPILKKAGTGPTKLMLAFQDSLSIFAICLMALGASSDSAIITSLAGLVLGMSISCAHNFFHQKDSWRRFYWDFGLLSSRDWRITHAISHHLFPNTMNDFEVSGLEPFVYFLPLSDKNWFVRFGSYVYCQAIAFLVFHIEFLKRLVVVLVLREQKSRPENLIPVLELLLMVFLSPSTIGRATWLWFLMHAWASYWFVATSVVASHHHPHIYHDGDQPRPDNDWGLHQIDSTRDVSGKSDNFFLVATTFGNHTLHHLFPTVDQTKLPLLYPVFQETCQEFGVMFKPRPALDMLIGTHQQMSRNWTSECTQENGRVKVNSNKKKN